MAQRTQTRPILASPRILLRSGDPAIVCFDGGIIASATSDAGPVPRRSPTPEGETFTALGFRQTEKPAKAGGKANTNGFRFRNESMRALARSFRNQPFLTGHDHGDVRARGGTIVDAYLEQLAASGEIAILYDIIATADWAKEGLANGTIDRFSIGATRGTGEITCTVHGAPVFVECICFPGEMVEFDGEQQLVEWQYEDPVGIELSAVNDPAVDGTFVVAAARDVTPLQSPVEARIAIAHQLAAVCGRPCPDLDLLAVGGGRAGGFPRASAHRTMTLATNEVNRMDPREKMARTLGLPADATWEQIQARSTELAAQAAQVETMRLQSEETSARLARSELETHVNTEITRLRAARPLSDRMVAHAREQAFGTEQAPVPAAQGRARFDIVVRTIEEQPAPPMAPPVTAARAPLQSDAAPARTDAAAIAAAPIPTEPDAFEQHASNPELARVMRACRITPDNVREHGPRAIPVVHNLGDLVAATAQRGA